MAIPEEPVSSRASDAVAPAANEPVRDAGGDTNNPTTRGVNQNAIALGRTSEFLSAFLVTSREIAFLIVPILSVPTTFRSVGSRCSEKFLNLRNVSDPRTLMF